ncbi:MAG: hypothetical protein QF535_15905 [Anaerolineales bacterium]|nr:hypothetical protein [Anaerolineales bacterium]
MFEHEGSEVRLEYHVSDLHPALNNLHFESHMPVAIDQSNSAFQHIALMMDDKKLAKRTNLADVDYHDVYQEIADRTPSLPKKYARKIIKLITLPWSYGAGNSTIVKRVRRYRNENVGKVPFLDELDSDGLNNLVSNAVDKLETEFKTCVDYKEEVYTAVDRARTKNPVYIEWRTPFDFVVHQKVHNARKPQNTVANGFQGDVELKVKMPTDTVDWSRMKTKAAPNLVHSYDASVIHGTLWADRFYLGKDKDGVPTAFGNPFYGDEDAPDEIRRDPKETSPPPWRGPVVTVHDSFACLASDMDELIQDIKYNFETTYIDYDPMRRFWSDIAKARRTVRKRRLQYQQSKEQWS